MKSSLMKLREEMGFSQKGMAKRLGINESTYNQYESGARGIPADVARAACDILGVDTDDIFLTKKFTVRKEE